MKNLLFITTILIINIITDVSAQITFQKSYKNADAELVGTYGRQTTDGGYIITGYSNGKALLIKTNNKGDTEWTKVYGSPNYCDSYCVQQTSDGGYIITGETIISSMGYNDVYLSRTDAEGNTLWTKNFGGPDNVEFGGCVVETDDHGFIIAGSTASFGAGIDDAYLIKTNENGDTVWTRTFGGNLDDDGAFVSQTTDGGYIMVGGTYSFGVGLDDIYLVRTNELGQIMWSKAYGGDNLDYGHSLQETQDGGFIIVGATYSFGAGKVDIYVVRTDANGDTLWTRTYGGAEDDYGSSIQQTIDGGFIIIGETNSFSPGSNDVYLLKTDADGRLLWSKSFGTEMSHEEGQSVQQTFDGGFIITGRTINFDMGGNGVYLIKTDANGNSGCNEKVTETITGTPATQVGNAETIVSSGGKVSTSDNPIDSIEMITSLCNSVGINETEDFNSITVTPNPFNNELLIQGTKEQGVMIIFDQMGKEIKRQNAFDIDSNLNTEMLMPGLYVLCYIEGNKYNTFKILKF